MKVVHADIGQRDDVRTRFLVEARVLGQLEHPSIVPVYDLGNDPGGSLYFTMKRVRGRTLEQVLEDRMNEDSAVTHVFSTRRLLADLSKLCLALDFVHRHEVIHRDVKPANVMIGDYGEVYLLDWGLAKVIGQSDDLETRERVDLGDSGPAETSYGTIMGTPGYMAPEQVQYQSDSLDARADVYSLGAILFEILAKQRLHIGKNPRELLASTMTRRETRPSVRAPALEIPPELDDLATRATAFDPDERIGSAREMHDAIERYLDGDRDVERRRTAARELVAGTEAALGRALEGGDEAARRSSLRALGHALALDPDNKPALRTMVRLLTEPPTELPSEVHDEIEELEVRQTRGAGRVGAIAFVSLNFWIPLVAAMGVKDWTPIAAFAVAANSTALVSWAVSRLPRPRTIHAMAVLVLGLLTASLSSLLFGPFVLAPSIIAVITLLFSLNHPPEWRFGIIGLGLLAMLGPAGLEWLGALPPSMLFTEHGLTLVPRWASLPPVPSIAILLLGNVGVIVTAGAAMAPIRRELDEAQLRMRLSAWQLRQLVPEDTTEEEPPA
jgi:serine/threonine-protein kinase